MAVPGLGFHGGLERHAWDLAGGLRARGHEPVLLHGKARGRDAAAFAEPFADVRPVDDPRCASGLEVAWVHRASGSGSLLDRSALPVAIATHDHELTCVRGSRYLPLSHEPCHRAPGAACVSHGCALVLHRSGDRAALVVRSPFALRRRLRDLARRGPLVANSRYVAGNLVAAGVEASRVRVVYPVSPEDPRPPRALPAEQRLLVVAQLVRGKGVDLAIEALALLDEDATLDVVGEGRSRGALERLASHRAPGRVRFHGYVPPARVTELYDECRLLVVPSRWPEPFGMVGVEAMRRSRPVVGAAHGAVPEWLEDGVGGALFAPGSVPELARAVRRVLAEPALAARACETASRRFAYERSIEQVEAILVGLLAGRRER